MLLAVLLSPSYTYHIESKSRDYKVNKTVEHGCDDQGVVTNGSEDAYLLMASLMYGRASSQLICSPEVCGGQVPLAAALSSSMVRRVGVLV